MTLDTSATIMDSIFQSDNEQSQSTLLKIIQDFLISEATKHSEHTRGEVCLGCLMCHVVLQLSKLKHMARAWPLEVTN